MTPTVEKISEMATGLGPEVFEVCQGVLEDERFPVWSGSSKDHQHHYGEGGLALHTLEVIETCFNIKDLYREKYYVNPRELFLAAFFHDVGKMYDYEPDPCYLPRLKYSAWKSTDHKRKIHHISRSGIIWNDNAKKNQSIYDMFFEDVYHAILSHHTTREYGSPVAPKSRVAWMLTLCDNVSARMNDADTFDVLGQKQI